MKEIATHRLSLTEQQQVESTVARAARASRYFERPRWTLGGGGLVVPRRSFLGGCAGIAAVTFLPLAWSGCDADGDGDVDLDDLVEVAIALVAVALSSFPIGGAIYGAMELINRSGAPWQGDGRLDLKQLVDQAIADSGLKAINLAKDAQEALGWGEKDNPNVSLTGKQEGDHQVSLTVGGDSGDTGTFKVIA